MKLGSKIEDILLPVGGDSSSHLGQIDVRGTNGLSAYQLWLLESGNAGKTYNEYTTSLKGADGLTTSVNGVSQINGSITLTKSNIGLANVDNTSDTNKPVSMVQQVVLDLKVDKVAARSLILDTEITRLAGIATGATNYTDAKALLAAPAETAATIKTALGITALSGSNTGDQPANNWTIEAGTGDSILTQNGVIVQRVVNTGAAGNVFTINGKNAIFGTITPIGSATPQLISFGATYGTNPPGDVGNLKWCLYDNGLPSSKYGIGMSSSLMSFVSGQNAEFGFYPNGGGVEAVKILSNGTLKAKATQIVIQPLTYAASVTIDYLLGANAKTTLTGNIALVLSNVADGGQGAIYLTQDAIGSRLLTGITHAGLTVKFKAADSTLTTTANATDIIYYERIGTLLLITLTKNY